MTFVHFGVVICLNMMIGLSTPPSVLFIAQTWKNEDYGVIRDFINGAYYDGLSCSWLLMYRILLFIPNNLWEELVVAAVRDCFGSPFVASLAARTHFIDITRSKTLRRANYKLMTKSFRRAFTIKSSKQDLASVKGAPGNAQIGISVAKTLCIARMDAVSAGTAMMME